MFSGAETRDVVASVCFVAATLQTLVAPAFQGKVQKNEIANFFFELEWIYTFWAALFLIANLVLAGNLNDITEISWRGPLTVMLLIAVFSAARVTNAIDRFFEIGSRLIHRTLLFFWRSPQNVSLPRVHFAVLLGVGPLLGSLISEPAAMTAIALILKRRYFAQAVSEKFRYSTLAVLFVNISIGGALTSFAAPAIIAVAPAWGWGSNYMLQLFGWKCIEAVLVSSIWLTIQYASEIHSDDGKSLQQSKNEWPIGVRLACFLLALEILMTHQSWWIRDVLAGISSTWLYFGAMAMTAVLDNAVITSLGSQISNLGPSERYYLVAGSLVGGGLTLLANGPNLIGQRILHNDKPWGHRTFFKAALLPTLIAALALLMY